MSNLCFNDVEGLRIAAEMERRGGEFYRHAARISKSKEAVELLTMLAEDEAIHEKEFNALLSGLLKLRSEEADSSYGEEASAYLSAIAAEVVFSGGLMDMVKDRGFESPAIILQNAIQSEKDSILFYTEMALLTRNAEIRAMFEEIVRQEKHHLNKLRKMLLELPVEG